MTTNGPLSSHPYFLRISDGDANAATKIQLSDGGPLIDQRRVLDPSFLELVRLGVLGPRDPRIVNTVHLVDQHLGYQTRNGPFWHRASFDGYGEKANGSQWQPTDPRSRLTHGRGWPLLTGERGEYQLAAGIAEGGGCVRERAGRIAQADCEVAAEESVGTIVTRELVTGEWA